LPPTVAFPHARRRLVGLSYIRTMRRWSIVLLLVALLPLRSWAAADMSASMAAGQAVAATVAMPCHGEEAEATSPLDDGASPASPHACLACDLCHAPLALLVTELPGLVPAPRAGPAPAPARDTGRLLAACLERPPRS
jgi:hypothetical protein